MIKYYKELEHPENISLLLYLRNPETKKEIDNVPIPLLFFEKYKPFFDNLDKFGKEIILLDKSKLVSELYENADVVTYSLDKECFHKDDPSAWMYEDPTALYKGVGMMYGQIDTIIHNIQNYIFPNIVITSSTNIYEMLNNYKDAFRYILPLYSNLNERYKSIYEELKMVQKELEKYNNIEYSSKKVLEDVVLPNSWYITPTGNLYNTVSIINRNNLGAHNLVKAYDSMTYHFGVIRIIGQESPSKLEILRNFQKNYSETKKKIIKNKNVTSEDFNFIRSVMYTVGPAFLTKSNTLNIDEISYNPDVISFTIGYYIAMEQLYKFAADLFEYTCEPNSKWFNILNTINIKKEEKYEVPCEFFVRCLGFHRIDPLNPKTIITSSLNPIEELKEYIENGWEIKIIPPILINKQNRNIDVYSMDELKEKLSSLKEKYKILFDENNAIILGKIEEKNLSDDEIAYWDYLISLSQINEEYETQFTYSKTIN